MTEMLDPQQRQQIHDAGRRLHGEFIGMFAQETIELVLYDSLDKLAHGARYGSFVPLLAERFTRQRLSSATRAHARGLTDTPSVLFVCVHNADRSQMAAGWLRHLAGDRAQAISAGPNPAEQVDPTAIRVMAEVGIDIADEYPKPWTGETLSATDVVITMGCGDACPVIPGKRYLDWEIDDPAGMPIDEVRPIRDAIEARIRELVTDLGIA